MLPSKFDEIMNTSDPFKLCNGVFCLFAEKYGNELDASTEPEPSRTITLVWHSFGIINNGGFGYLFEGKFKGDPDFSITAEAYKKIGAISSYNKFYKIIQSYNKPIFSKLKDRIMSFIFNKTNPLDQMLLQHFGEEEKEIIGCLSKFITSSRDGIRKLLSES